MLEGAGGGGLVTPAIKGQTPYLCRHPRGLCVDRLSRYPGTQASPSCPRASASRGCERGHQLPACLPAQPHLARPPAGSPQDAHRSGQHVGEVAGVGDQQPEKSVQNLSHLSSGDTLMTTAAQ